MDNSTLFYYGNWKHAEILGDLEDAAYWKERYRVAVMNNLERPYHFVHYRLKRFPMINLN